MLAGTQQYLLLPCHYPTWYVIMCDENKNQIIEEIPKNKAEQNTSPTLNVRYFVWNSSSTSTVYELFWCHCTHITLIWPEETFTHRFSFGWYCLNEFYPIAHQTHFLSLSLSFAFAMYCCQIIRIFIQMNLKALRRTFKSSRVIFCCVHLLF